MFSSSYVRWFRDIAAPSDDIPVSLALSDANHAVSVAHDMMGPVHLNIQFRENLAPDSGPIRGDNRIDSTTSFSSPRFTDVPGFSQWSANGNAWSQSYSSKPLTRKSYHDHAAYDIARLIAQSRRAIIVVGSLKSSTDTDRDYVLQSSSIISHFAQFAGIPIFAGVQNVPLRYQSPAVIPYAGKI